jgi:hypothetical protein
MSGLPRQIRLFFAAFVCVAACAVPAIATADTGGSSGTSGSDQQQAQQPYTGDSGGTSPDDPQFQPHGKAKLLPNGLAEAPSDAPPEVQAVIAAGNEIATLPYIYGGGHASFHADGYDCSGSVSYALAAAGLVTSPMVSGAFESWGDPGPGRWITVYANAGHVWMEVAGWRFDTVALAEGGTRWSRGGGEFAGFVVRHPPGL